MIQKIKPGELLFKVDDIMPLLRYVEGYLSLPMDIIIMLLN